MRIIPGSFLWWLCRAANGDMVLSVLHEDPETHKMRLAISRGEYNALRRLLEAGAYANYHFVSGITEYPLHVAIAKEDIEIIKLLLNYGASTRGTDSASLTALHYAAMGNNVEIMRNREDDTLCVIAPFCEMILLLLNIQH